MPLIIIAALHVAQPTQTIADDQADEIVAGEAADAELAFSRGIVLYEQGDIAGALAEFEQAGDHPAAMQYARLCSAQYTVPAEGGEFDAGSYAPTEEWEAGPEEQFASDYNSDGQWNETEPLPPQSEKYWHVSLLTGHQYDSNVSLEPEFVGLGEGRGIEDSSWLVAGYGDYQIVHYPDWNLGLIASAFSNTYFSANEFDAQDFMGGFYTNRIVAYNVMASLRYEFHEMLLGSDSFAQEHRLVPNLTLLQGDFGHTTFYYEFDSQHFEGLPLIPAMDRSGETYSGGFTQAIYTFKGLGRWFAGYRFARGDANGSDFDFESNMLTVRTERPTSKKTVVDVEVRQFWDRYRNPNSLDFFERLRSDDRTEVRAGWQWYMTAHTSIRLDYTYINSDSNTQNLFGVRFFDFDRNLLASQFIIDF